MASSTAPLPELQSTRQRLGLDEATLLRLLQKFIQNHQADGARLEQLLEAQAWQEAATLAHSLKGMGASLGLTTLAMLAATIERMLGSPVKQPEDLEQATRLARRIDFSLQRTSRRLAILSRQPSARQAGTTSKNALEALLESVQNHEIAALAQAERLYREGDARLQPLVAALEEFDFEQAGKLLEALLSGQHLP